MTTFLRIFRAGDCINQAGLDYARELKKDGGTWDMMTNNCPFPSSQIDSSCY